ncbi:sulfotransferase family protein [Sphingomonas baiyangensis]|uniref:sulfotransferase family protein n=1 Tax=Sphingomonas baiyangensis TaxID=2572576 RepID=UPI001BB0C275|nr:sulfotransferase [Sphingomonas baiyangensis]
MPPRYVFVGGLHRSGTSLVASLIAAAPGVAAIASAPVPEQEGVYLQGAIPHTARHGIPGSFALDPAQHLTEASACNRHEVAQRIAAEWAPWFVPADAPLRVEKSPVNLLRARLYQQLFPTSLFVFVVRHPLAVARATAKWSVSDEAALLDHWEAAHALLLGDLPFLHNYLVLRYEDLASDSTHEIARLSAFLGVALPAPDAPIANRNRDYAGPPAAAAGPVARRFGYGDDPLALAPPQVAMGAHYFRSALAGMAHRDAAGR